MTLCTHQVTHCSLFVGLLGLSHGSHFEFGLAYALKKPAILVGCREIDQSFVATGMGNLGDRVLVIECELLRDVPKVLATSVVGQFVKRVRKEAKRQ